MKIRFYLLLSVLCFIIVLIGFFPHDVKADGDYVPGEIIVKFSSQVSDKGTVNSTGISELDKMNANYSVTSMEPVYPQSSGQITSSSPALCTYKINFPSDKNVFEAVRAYGAIPGVLYAEPNYLLHANSVPNDPGYTTQQPYLDTMSVSSGWDVTTGSSSVVIAVVDTGVEWYNQDLTANIWTNSREIPGNNIDDDGNGFIDDVRGWDFVSVSSAISGEDVAPRDNNPDDFAGHGTFVASQAAAAGNNSFGVSGIGWNTKIMPVRAGYMAGSSDYGSFETADLAGAITYAADNGADIINLSLGAPGGTVIQSLADAVNYALGKGIIVIAASGNRNGSVTDFPANMTGVLAVGSITSAGTVSSFSNPGTVYAVGSEVYGSFPLSSTQSETGGARPSTRTGFKTANGTSFSTPITSGLAALILSVNSSFTKDQVVNQIVNYSDTLSSGIKRINVYRSLTEGELGGKTINYNLSSGWNLIAFPFQSVSSVTGFSGEFYYDEGKGEEVKITDIKNLEPGKAYWVYSASSVTATATGVPVYGSSFTRTLSVKSMMPVSNPFIFSSSVSWSSSNVTSGGKSLTTLESLGALSGTIYYYDTATQSFKPVSYGSGTIDITVGYYLTNNAGTEITITR